MRTLEEITTALRGLAHGDPEQSHSDADELLLLAIELLGEDSVFDGQVSDLISAYRDVPKWYA